MAFRCYGKVDKILLSLADDNEPSKHIICPVFEMPSNPLDFLNTGNIFNGNLVVM